MKLALLPKIDIQMASEEEFNSFFNGKTNFEITTPAQPGHTTGQSWKVAIYEGKLVGVNIPLKS